MISQEQLRKISSLDETRRATVVSEYTKRKYGRQMSQDQANRIAKADPEKLSAFFNRLSGTQAPQAPKKDVGVWGRIKSIPKKLSQYEQSIQKAFQDKDAQRRKEGGSLLGLAAKNVGESVLAVPKAAARETLKLGAGAVDLATAPFRGEFKGGLVDKINNIEALKTEGVGALGGMVGGGLALAAPGAGVSAISKGGKLVKTLQVAGTEAAVGGLTDQSVEGAVIGGALGGVGEFLNPIKKGASLVKQAEGKVDDAIELQKGIEGEVKLPDAPTKTGNIGAVTKVTGNADEILEAAGETGNVLKKVANQVNRDDAKIKSDIMQGLNRGIVKKALSKKQIAEVNRALETGFDSNIIKSFDKVSVDWARKIRTMLDDTHSMATDSGLTNAQGKTIGYIENYIPMDYNVPTGEKAFAKWFDGVKALNPNKSESELLEKITGRKGVDSAADIDRDSLGGRFGSFEFSRGDVILPQERDVIERVFDYLEGSSREIALQRHFGPRNKAGELSFLDDYVSKSVGVERNNDRKALLNAIRAKTEDRATKYNVDIMKESIDEKTRHAMRNAEITENGLSGYEVEKVPGSPKLMADSSMKMANTISSLVVGPNAFFSDVLVNPMRSIMMHGTMRSLRGGFLWGAYGRERSAVEKLINTMDLLNPSKNIRRSEGFEARGIAEKIVNINQSLTGQNLGMKMSTKIHKNLSIDALSGAIERLKKTPTARDIEYLETEFGFTDQMIEAAKKGELPVEDFAYGIVHSIEKSIFGKKGAEMVLVHEYGPFVQSMFKFLRYPYVATKEAKRVVQRDGLVGAGKVIAGTGAVGYTVDKVSEMDNPYMELLADTIGVSEKDDQRNPVMTMSNNAREWVGQEDNELIDTYARAMSTYFGLDMFLGAFTGIIGYSGENPSTSANIIGGMTKKTVDVGKDIISGDNPFETQGRAQKSSAEKLSDSVGSIRAFRDLIETINEEDDLNFERFQRKIKKAINEKRRERN